ncbi:myosin phosphatase Rho-interacting protein isoform X2 [Periophthalmus magnuspinnatus]|uniref:myosin phosphatase Rho-interacting protein isoform X2 n=1 Tax=Periophthalmus magnuspinnatus TaxID=409849 RepID=UPI00145B7BB6|nr:myosin phosphatase Rho-interacting protein isoform X2 [Periophthalmus magnuspinnatus]
MSAAKENPCRKFQANFFNKSKCQNCFKPRELHLLTDQDLNQAKPIYGGWLCLAPEGTDFDNPMQRSRKWQRRFFVLYEHGCLRFALDESPSTLPQGTVNMNQCTDVIDAEPKTGQKNSLCIITPEQEYFIRGENKEIINGWSEQLSVYPRTNKQNQKKKRKVEPATSQEPGPAKVAVTGSGIPETEKGPDSSSIIWQEELSQREADGTPLWATADLPPTGAVTVSSDLSSLNGDEVDRSSSHVLHASAPQSSSDPLSPTGSCSSLGGVPRCLSPAPSDPFPSGSSLLSNGSHISGSLSSLDSDASGSTVTSGEGHSQASHRGYHHDTPRARRLEAEARKAEKRSRHKSPDRKDREALISPERSRSGVIEKLEALELENQEKMEVDECGRSEERQGRSQHRRFHREEQGQDPDFPSTLPPLRRAKSLDRRTTESVMTPDLLNFKKGWMVKLDEQGQWKKYWFVLTDHSLRYYKDSIAEEASDLDGEIDLSTCYNVTEYQAQRNYGFQIHTQEGVHTLSAMTAGIRRNWIQAVMKNVRPSTAPDVASSTEDHSSFSPLEGLVRPDVTQDSPSSETSSVDSPSVAKSRARERRREGRSKTFDWAEFRPIAQALAQQRAQEAESLQADLGELEKSRRREERRKRYESMTSSVVDSAEEVRTEPGSTGDNGGSGSLERQQRVEEVIEQHWRQVEKTPIREERRVPLAPAQQHRQASELEHLLDTYKQGMEELKAQLESCHQQLLESNRHKEQLEQQLRSALEREQDIRPGYISPLEPPLGLEADVTPQMKKSELVSSQAQSLTRKYQETKELLKLQELKKRSMQAQLGLTLSHLPIKDTYFSDTPPPEPVLKSISLLLHDSSEAIQELEDMITDKTITTKELSSLLKSHSCNRDIPDRLQLQKILESWKCQQEITNETIRKNLAKAGESIRQYEARLLTMEEAVGKVQRQSFEGLKHPFSPCVKIENHSEKSDMTIGMLSQKVELLTCENGALKQRCQEIVNQLTEADREIDRLKAELICQQGGKQHHLIMEELKMLKTELAENQANAIDREYYERELNEKSLRLHEALVTLEELGTTLKDTEKKLQLKEATLKGLGFTADMEGEDLQPEKDQLQELLETSHTKLQETEAQLESTEQRCKEFENRNKELTRLNQESEAVLKERLTQMEEEIQMLRGKLETQSRLEKPEYVQTRDVQVADKEEQMVEEFERKSEALRQVLDMVDQAEVNVERMLLDLRSTLFEAPQDGPLVVSRADWRVAVEGEFWSQMSQIHPSVDRSRIEFTSLVGEIIAQEQANLKIRRICHHAKSDEASEDFAAIYSWFDIDTYSLILQELRNALQEKLDLSVEMVSGLKQKDERFISLAQDSKALEGRQKHLSDYLHNAFKEASWAYVMIRMNVEHARKQSEMLAGNLECTNCLTLKELASNLQSKVDDLQSQISEVDLKIQIEGKAIDSVDKTIELQDMLAKHKKELRELKESYEQENHNLQQDLAKVSEALHLRSEENVKEIDSLTNCMENLQKKHEAERKHLTEKFNQETEELWNLANQANLVDNIAFSPQTLKEHIQELVRQVSAMSEEKRQREEQDDPSTLQRKYEQELENLKATCERGFAAMEESHQKVIDELQKKHQRELENLQEEKERLLAEETAATIAAIEAMKNAHRTELEKELDKARKANNNAENADMEEVRRQHEEELGSFQREIEVLSEQYSQKCLENAHLAQALEAERQALRQCQRENQELNAHNQELNNRLAAEITRMRSMVSEEGSGEGTTIQGKELYELEVMLRVKESEVQYLKQEINSLKDELQAAQRDKKYATDKYKDIYTELSIVKAKAERDLGRLREQLQLAHEALGEAELEEVDRGGYDIMKSKSNPDILKMAAAAAKRSERTMRSKSVSRDMPWDS